MDTFCSVSVVIPTLNSAKTLGLCLDSIITQSYPKDRLEVIFADGGSSDDTLKIINEFKNKPAGVKIKVVENKLRTGESGKAVALKVASGDIVAFIDSDNILEGSDWLKAMIRPFIDKEIIACEPIRYTYRKTDGYVTRYCALMGMNDPLCYFFGNYDRECVLSGHWTQMPFELIEDNELYLKLKLDHRRLPTIGANGFLIRRDELDKINFGDYLFDIDVLAEILAQAPFKCISKVKLGIIHIFTGTLAGFFRKQKRRIADFKYFNKSGLRKYQWGKMSKVSLAYFLFCCLSVLPLVFQAIRGYVRRKDLCWLAHIIFCWITCYAYATGFICGGNFIARRDKWQV